MPRMENENDKKPSAMRSAYIVGGILAALTFAVLILAVIGAQKVTCEVCMTFNGRTECRAAVGKTPEEAVRTATSNACALLAGGMTDTVSCTSKAPDSAVCN